MMSFRLEVVPIARISELMERVRRSQSGAIASYVSEGDKKKYHPSFPRAENL
ncbi:MAG: hypothetical protein EBE86_011615 [Hormoscilla sp. GUM202]|nr:hypothetical protein [Hormoscilla sp. GUM202]